MIPTKVLTEELLQQVAAELAMALNDSLPPPAECQHKFLMDLKKKMCALINGIGTNCYAVSIQDSIIRK